MKAAEFCLISVGFLVLELVYVQSGSADPDDIRKLTAGARKACIAETGTTLQAVEDTEYGDFPEDDRLKCYFKCTLMKLSMMDKNGKIRYHLLKKVIPEPYKKMGYEMIDSCTDVTSSNICEKAFNFMKCMYQVNPMVSRNQ